MGCVTPPDWLKEYVLAEAASVDGCWVWTGHIMKSGYGRKRVGPKKILAHRFVYERMIGPIPSGLTIDHLCRNRACVRPDHLDPVTAYENFLRGGSPIARNAMKVGCPRCGEPLLRITSYGGRRCRTCTREAKRLWARKNRAANPGKDAAYQRARYAKRKLPHGPPPPGVADRQGH